MPFDRSQLYYGDAYTRLRKAGFDVVHSGRLIFAHKGDAHHEFTADHSGLYDANEIDAAIAAAKA